MPSLKSFAETTWEKFLVLFGTLGVLLPVSPLNMPLTFRDPGVFLYMGQRILSGDIPYRDVWDHKPPIIFYINAVGLGLADGSRWGVWVLELLSLFLAAWVGYKLVRQYFGTFPAVFSLLIWQLSLVGILQGGNFTTEFTLPLQFTALWLSTRTGEPLKADVRFFFLGLLGGLAFFTKQTTVGLWAAIFLYLLIERFTSQEFKRGLREVFFMGTGALTVAAFIVGFFILQNALPQFWSAAFEYNFLYAERGGAELTQRIEALLRGLRPLTFTGLIQFGLFGYALTLIFTLTKRVLPKESMPMLAILLIDLPIELALVSITEKTFLHYYITLIPALAILTAVSAWAVAQVILQWKFAAWARSAAALFIMGVFVWSYVDNYLDQTYIYRKNRDDAAIQYLLQNSTPEDTVLLWGAEAAVNFFSQRESPSRFVYQYPLHNEGYVTESMVLEFLTDVSEKRPRFIVATQYEVPLYEFPFVTDEINEKTAYLRSHYCPIQEIDDWVFYTYSTETCTP